MKCMCTISRIAAVACCVASLAFLCPMSALSLQVRKTEGVRVDVQRTLQSLLSDEDTDGDSKITIADVHRRGSSRGDREFTFTAIDGRRYAVAGTYRLANLLQELTLAAERSDATAIIAFDTIFELPTHHLSRIIREVCWDGLTRTMDAKGLLRILADEKVRTRGGARCLYVPASDTSALVYYAHIARLQEATITVVPLPAAIDEKFLRSLNDRHGLLSLAFTPLHNGGVAPAPFVVPGGRFNELYGWDSFFITLGLLADGRNELARSLVDHLVYEIEHYGKILNANRTYYLTRSQPPFLTSMARAVYAALPKGEASKAWLRTTLSAAIHEYRYVWMGTDHLTDIGLSRYFDPGRGPCPEVEPGHYDDVYAHYAVRHRMTMRAFRRAYEAGRVSDTELDDYFVHDRAMRESGHDTSYRLVGRAAHLAAIDLNSLLFKIEMDIADLVREEFGGTFTTIDGMTVTSDDYVAYAQKRKLLVNTYLWDSEAGIYFDYDVATRTRTGYLSAASLYPLWAGLATATQAASLISHALPALEQAGGIAASGEASRGALSKLRKERQWDFPYGWAPHQMLLWIGLQRYGYDSLTQRLIYKWLYAMTLNAVNYNGTITEKINVVTRSHDVFAEYGNIGTKFAYITREGFGWTNASYQVGLHMLSPALRTRLDQLIPPEWISSFERKEQP